MLMLSVHIRIVFAFSHAQVPLSNAPLFSRRAPGVIARVMNVLVAFVSVVCDAKCRASLGFSSGVVDGLSAVAGGYTICGDYPVFRQFPYSSPTLPLQFPYTSTMEIYTVPLHFFFRNRKVWMVYFSLKQN